MDKGEAGALALAAGKDSGDVVDLLGEEAQLRGALAVSESAEFECGPLPTDYAVPRLTCFRTNF